MRLRAGDVLLMAAGAVVGYRLHVASVVEGSSMAPTLLPSDRILHVPLWVLRRPPVVGDVVLARVSDRMTVCKRVLDVGTAADKALWEREAFRDDFEEDHLPLGDGDDGDGEGGEEGLPPQDHQQRPRRARDWEQCQDAHLHDAGQWLWLEGDNPPQSFDSRHAGAVPVECITGIALVRWWPARRLAALT